MKFENASLEYQNSKAFKLRANLKFAVIMLVSAGSKCKECSAWIEKAVKIYVPVLALPKEYFPSLFLMAHIKCEDSKGKEEKILINMKTRMQNKHFIVEDTCKMDGKEDG